MVAVVGRPQVHQAPNFPVINSAKLTDELVNKFQKAHEQDEALPIKPNWNIAFHLEGDMFAEVKGPGSKIMKDTGITTKFLTFYNLPEHISDTVQASTSPLDVIVFKAKLRTDESKWLILACFGSKNMPTTAECNVISVNEDGSLGALLMDVDNQHFPDFKNSIIRPAFAKGDTLPSNTKFEAPFHLALKRKIEAQADALIDAHDTWSESLPTEDEKIAKLNAKVAAKFIPRDELDALNWDVTMHQEGDIFAEIKCPGSKIMDDTGIDTRFLTFFNLPAYFTAMEGNMFDLCPLKAKMRTDGKEWIILACFGSKGNPIAECNIMPIREDGSVGPVLMMEDDEDFPDFQQSIIHPLFQPTLTLESNTKFMRPQAADLKAKILNSGAAMAGAYEEVFQCPQEPQE